MIQLHPTTYVPIRELTSEELLELSELQKKVEFDDLENRTKRYLEEHPEERDAFEVMKMVMQLYVLKHGSVTEVKCK